VGEVRPPLHEPTEDHVKQLAQLIERGYALLEPLEGPEGPEGEGRLGEGE
jgi:5-dehydro-4-deoxyglucarate dehydratase